MNRYFLSTLWVLGVFASHYGFTQSDFQLDCDNSGYFTNIALFGTTTSLNQNSGNESSFAIDGIVDNNFTGWRSSGSTVDTLGWWQLELPCEAIISEIQILPYQRNYSDLYNSFRVEASITGAFAGEETILFVENDWPELPNKSYHFNPIRTKFIRFIPLEIHAFGLLHEFRVFNSIGNNTGLITAENFPDANFRNAVISFLRNDRYGADTLEELALRTGSFDCSNLNIRNLKGIEFLPNITELNCRNNALTKLDLSGNTKLKIIQCGGNQITELKLRNHESLTELETNNQLLTTLDVSGAVNLESLRVISTRLNEIDLTSNIHLKELYATNSFLEHLSFASDSEIEVIHVNNCRFVSLQDFMLLPNLHALDIRLNQLNCEDWNDVKQLESRIHAAVIDRFDFIQDGLAYDPQNGFDPYQCGQQIEQYTAEEPVQLNILVIHFNPVIPRAGNRRLDDAAGFRPYAAVDGYIYDLTVASRNFIQCNIVEWIETDAIPAKERTGFVYNPDDYFVKLERDLQLPQPVAADDPVIDQNVQGWYRPRTADYYRIIENYDLVRKVDEKDIDEVWLIGHHEMGFYESAMAGPAAFRINGPVLNNVPTKKRFVFMAFSPQQQPNLHGLGHRAEATMEYQYGGWTIGALNTTWERFAANAYESNGVSAVGTVHFPPNGRRHYDYANDLTVMSSADDWLNYPNLTGTLKPVNKDTWGGPDYHRNYMIWWFNHFPQAPGINEEDGKLNNWWHYIFSLDNPIAYDPTPTQTPTQTNTPTVTNTPTITPTFTPRPGNHIPVIQYTGNTQFVVDQYSAKKVTLFIMDEDSDAVTVTVTPFENIVNQKLTAAGSRSIFDFTLNTSIPGEYSVTVQVYDGSDPATINFTYTVNKTSQSLPTPTITPTSLPTSSIPTPTPLVSNCQGLTNHTNIAALGIASSQGNIGDPGLAIDGDTVFVSSNWDSEGQNGWWQVELPCDIRVYRFELYPWSSNFHDFYLTYDVMGSLSGGFSGEEIMLVSEKNRKETSVIQYEISPTLVKFIRIIPRESHPFARLQEFKVFPAIDPTPTPTSRFRSDACDNLKNDTDIAELGHGSYPGVFQEFVEKDAINAIDGDRNTFTFLNNDGDEKSWLLELPCLISIYKIRVEFSVISLNNELNRETKVQILSSQSGAFNGEEKFVYEIAGLTNSQYITKTVEFDIDPILCKYLKFRNMDPFEFPVFLHEVNVYPAIEPTPIPTNTATPTPKFKPGICNNLNNSTNIASLGIASSQGNIGNPSLAIDGDTLFGASTWFSEGQNGWWQVELPCEKEVYRMEIYPWSTNNHDFYISYDILGSLTGSFNGEEVVLVSESNRTNTKVSIYEISPTLVKFIRIVPKEPHLFARLQEFKVFPAIEPIPTPTATYTPTPRFNVDCNSFTNETNIAALGIASSQGDIGGPHLAIDGDTTSSTSNWDSSGQNGWWQVELPCDLSIYKIELYPWSLNYFDFYLDFEITGSLTGEFKGEEITLVKEYNRPRTNILIYNIFPTNIKYLRIIPKREHPFAKLQEIKIYPAVKPLQTPTPLSNSHSNIIISTGSNGERVIGKGLIKDFTFFDNKIAMISNDELTIYNEESQVISSNYDIGLDLQLIEFNKNNNEFVILSNSTLYLVDSTSYIVKFKIQISKTIQNNPFNNLIINYQTNNAYFSSSETLYSFSLNNRSINYIINDLNQNSAGTIDNIELSKDNKYIFTITSNRINILNEINGMIVDFIICDSINCKSIDTNYNLPFLFYTLSSNNKYIIMSNYLITILIDKDTNEVLQTFEDHIQYVYNSLDNEFIMILFYSGKYVFYNLNNNYIYEEGKIEGTSVPSSRITIKYDEAKNTLYINNQASIKSISFTTGSIKYYDHGLNLSYLQYQTIPSDNNLFNKITDNKIFIPGGRSNDIFILDLINDSNSFSVIFDEEIRDYDYDVSSDGRYLAFIANHTIPNYIYIVDLINKSIFKKLDQLNYVIDFKYSSDSNIINVLESDGYPYEETRSYLYKLNINENIENILLYDNNIKYSLFSLTNNEEQIVIADNENNELLIFNTISKNIEKRVSIPTKITSMTVNHKYAIIYSNYVLINYKYTDVIYIVDLDTMNILHQIQEFRIGKYELYNDNVLKYSYYENGEDRSSSLKLFDILNGSSLNFIVNDLYKIKNSDYSIGILNDYDLNIFRNINKYSFNIFKDDIVISSYEFHNDNLSGNTLLIGDYILFTTSKTGITYIYNVDKLFELILTSTPTSTPTPSNTPIPTATPYRFADIDCSVFDNNTNIAQYGYVSTEINNGNTKAINDNDEITVTSLWTYTGTENPWIQIELPCELLVRKMEIHIQNRVISRFYSNYSIYGSLTGEFNGEEILLVNEDNRPLLEKLEYDIQPTLTRFIRLVPLSDSSRLYLYEFKIFADIDNTHLLNSPTPTSTYTPTPTVIANIDEIVLAQGEGGSNLVSIRNFDNQAGIPVNSQIDSYRVLNNTIINSIGGGSGRTTYLSSGDLNHDGYMDLVFTFGVVKDTAAHPNIVIPFDLKTKQPIGHSFSAFPNGTENSVRNNSGELRTAVGDFMMDGQNLMAVAQGFGSQNGLVRLFRYTGQPRPNSWQIVSQFQPLDDRPTQNNANGGVTLIAGDLDNDGLDELLVGQTNSNTSLTQFTVIDVDPNGINHVRNNFVAFPPGFRGQGGIELTVTDLNGDGMKEIVAAGKGNIGTSDTGNVFSIIRPVVVNNQITGFTRPDNAIIKIIGNDLINPGGGLSIASGELDGDSSNGDEIVFGSGEGAPQSFYRVMKINYDPNQGESGAVTSFTYLIGPPRNLDFVVNAFVNEFNPSSGAVYVGTIDYQ